MTPGTDAACGLVGVDPQLAIVARWPAPRSAATAPATPWPSAVPTSRWRSAPSTYPAAKLSTPATRRPGIASTRSASVSTSSTEGTPVRPMPASTSMSTSTVTPAGPSTSEAAQSALDGIDREPDRDPVEEPQEPLELGPPDEGVGDEQVLEAGVNERLRLAELGHREPAGAVGELALGDLARLVGLGVRPMGRVRAGDASGHASEIRLEDRDIHEGHRRVEVTDERRAGPPSARRAREVFGRREGEAAREPCELRDRQALAIAVVRGVVGPVADRRDAGLRDEVDRVRGDRELRTMGMRAPVSDAWARWRASTMGRALVHDERLGDGRDVHADGGACLLRDRCRDVAQLASATSASVSSVSWRRVPWSTARSGSRLK